MKLENLVGRSKKFFSENYMFFLVVLLMLLFSSTGFAADGSGFNTGGLMKSQAETIISNVLAFLQGDFMKFVGIVAFIAAGAMFVMGESQGWFKTALKVVIPLAILSNVGTILIALGIDGALIY